ncbi:MAG: hypothetical protein EHM48_03710 [Planctomycetaceae bacterium]|nr:MAG: hypothetical protein EHM48_03710 [Planctomycetaceae bacterium]
MFCKKMFACLAAATVVTLAVGSPAFSQDAKGGGFGGGDPEAIRKAIADYQKQANLKLKESLGATDDEWTVLEPKIQKVQTLSMQTMTQNAGGMFGGRGMAVGGAISDKSSEEMTNLQKTKAELKKVTDNKDSKPEDVKKALTEYRDAAAKVKALQDKTKADLEKAQKELKDVVTATQEAKLVLAGMLP